VAEIREMLAAGIILEDERFELIGGEVVPMSPKGNRHEVVKQALQQYWFPMIARSPTCLITETTLYTGVDEFLEPDFIFWPRSIPLAEITAAAALLLVEIADSSVRYDLGRKARMYAGLGLRDYWVIEAERLITHIHREPDATGYRSKTEHTHKERVIPALVPELGVALADLGLQPAAM
jgi:Uma2 family endonuclease